MYEVLFIDPFGKGEERKLPFYDLELLRTWAKIQAWNQPAGTRVRIRRRSGVVVIEYCSNGEARPTELL